MVFIAELFWWFENVKPDFVQPRDVQELKELAKSELPYLLTWDAESDAAFTLDSASCENGFRIKKDGTGLRLCLSCGFLLIVK